MHKTGLAASYSKDPPISGFIRSFDGTEEKVDPRHMIIAVSKPWGGGSIISTLEDMERWTRGYYNNSFLSPDSRQEIATSFIIRNTDTKDCVIVLSNQRRESESLTEDVAMHLWEMLAW